MSEAEIEKKVTHTYCQICEQICGLKVTSQGDKILSIRADTANPYSWRDFCIKGSTSDQSRTHPNRIVAPMKRVRGRYIESSYEEAIGDISARLTQLIEQHGPDSIADYLGNPGAISYNNTMFNNAFFAALGTRNRYYVGSIDHNAHLVVSRAMYGSPAATMQTDVDRCDCLMLVGANPAISRMNWLGRVPDGWNRIKKRVAAGKDLIIVDPRRSESARHATIHVAPLPETDWAFLLAVIHIIFDRGWESVTDCDAATHIDGLKAIARSADVANLAARCDVPVATMEEVARRFATAATAACIARTGTSQGSNGALTEWLAQALNVICGRIDKPGCRFFPTFPTNPLARKPGYKPADMNDRPSRVRGLRPVEGTYCLAELPDEILTPGAGQIRALFLNSGNPVVSGPDGATLDRAFATLDLMVSIDLFQRESHRHSHWLIPGLHFLERDEVNVSAHGANDEAFIRASRAAVPPPPGVRPEWEFFRDLAAAMKLKLFGGKLDPHPDALARRALNSGGQVTLEEVLESEHGIHRGHHTIGHFHQSLQTGDGRIDICPTSFALRLEHCLAQPVARPDASERPYQIISRRSRHMMNSWLAETTARSTTLTRPDSVEIARDDAAGLGIVSGDHVVLESAAGNLAAIAIVSEDIRPGVMVIEQGWGSGLFDPKTNALVSRTGVNRNSLVDRLSLDPLTGVPRLNGTPVSARAVAKAN